MRFAKSTAAFRPLKIVLAPPVSASATLISSAGAKREPSFSPGKVDGERRKATGGGAAECGTWTDDCRSLNGRRTGAGDKVYGAQDDACAGRALGSLGGRRRAETVACAEISFDEINIRLHAACSCSFVPFHPVLFPGGIVRFLFLFYTLFYILFQLCPCLLHSLGEAFIRSCPFFYQVETRSRRRLQQQQHPLPYETL